MKRTLQPWLVVTLLLCMAMGAGVLAGPLRVGIYGDAPPKSFIDENGELAGFDVDFARALCRQIDRQCELVHSEWDELIQGLIANRLDVAVASISITDQRRRLIDFTRPYYDSPARFVARDDGRFTTLDPEVLQGVRLGVRQGTTFDDYVTDKLAGRGQLYRYITLSDAVADLVLGRLDLVIGDHLTLEQNFLKTDLGEGFRFVGPPIRDVRWFGEGMGVGLAKGEVALRKRLNRAIAELQRNGVFERIEERWYGYEVRNLTAVLMSEAETAGQ
jgi:ABC-type amino acid transport substrate-binding protein